MGRFSGDSGSSGTSAAEGRGLGGTVGLVVGQLVTLRGVNVVYKGEQSFTASTRGANFTFSGPCRLLEGCL